MDYEEAKQKIYEFIINCKTEATPQEIMHEAEKLGLPDENDYAYEVIKGTVVIATGLSEIASRAIVDLMGEGKIEPDILGGDPQLGVLCYLMDGYPIPKYPLLTKGKKYKTKHWLPCYFKKKGATICR